eukprot:3619785-Pleurochrysis_carterae.AAC.1
MSKLTLLITARAWPTSPDAPPTWLEPTAQARLTPAPALAPPAVTEGNSHRQSFPAPRRWSLWAEPASYGTAAGAPERPPRTR